MAAKKKDSLTIFWIFLGGLAILIIGIIYVFKKNMNDDIKFQAYNRYELRNFLPADYGQIAKTFQNANYRVSITSHSRNPIASFNYGQKLKMLIYKLPVNSTKPLSEIVDMEFINTEIPDGVGYSSFSDDHYMTDRIELFDIYFKERNLDKGNQIISNLFGSNNRLIAKNDTIVSYSSNVNDFSFRYGKTQDADFNLVMKDASLKVTPTQIEFRKYKNSTYFILIYQNRK